jgi:hypothetical protein
MLTLRAAAARQLGQRTSAANARGWYLTEALQIEGGMQFKGQPLTIDAIRRFLGTPTLFLWRPPPSLVDDYYISLQQGLIFFLLLPPGSLLPQHVVAEKNRVSNEILTFILFVYFGYKKQVPILPLTRLAVGYKSSRVMRAPSRETPAMRPRLEST